MEKVFRGNDFQYGQSRVKTLIYAGVGCALLALVCGLFSKTIESVLMIVTLVIIAWAFVVLFRYCKCPHCGHRIVFGVLAVTTCPACRRSLTTGKKVKKSK